MDCGLCYTGVAYSTYGNMGRADTLGLRSVWNTTLSSCGRWLSQRSATNAYLTFIVVFSFPSAVVNLLYKVPVSAWKSKPRGCA